MAYYKSKFPFEKISKQKFFGNLNPGFGCLAIFTHLRRVACLKGSGREDEPRTGIQN